MEYTQGQVMIMIRAFDRLRKGQDKAGYTFCSGQLPRDSEKALESIIKQALKINEISK